jgi:hypothetical protein
MSIGNLKDTGNQGNNMPWQWKMLQGIQAIATATSAPLTCVDDSVTICNANIDAFTFTNILGDDALNVNIAGGVTLEVNLDAANDQVGVYGYVSGLAGSPVPLNVNAQGQVAIQDDGNSITVDAISLPLPTGAATEVTLGDIKTSVQLIDDCVGTDNTAAPAKSFVVAGVTSGGTQQTIEVNASGHVHIADGGGSITVDSNAAVRTPTVLRTSANSSVAAGAYSVSFASVGTVDSTVGGATLKPGETINFDAGGINNTLGAVVYDSSAAGAELLIITLT